MGICSKWRQRSGRFAYVLLQNVYGSSYGRGILLEIKKYFQKRAPIMFFSRPVGCRPNILKSFREDFCIVSTFFDCPSTTPGCIPRSEASRHPEMGPLRLPPHFVGWESDSSPQYPTIPEWKTPGWIIYHPGMKGHRSKYSHNASPKHPIIGVKDPRTPPPPM